MLPYTNAALLKNCVVTLRLALHFTSNVLVLFTRWKNWWEQLYIFAEVKWGKSNIANLTNIIAFIDPSGLYSEWILISWPVWVPKKSKNEPLKKQKQNWIFIKRIGYENLNQNLYFSFLFDEVFQLQCCFCSPSFTQCLQQQPSKSNVVAQMNIHSSNPPPPPPPLPKGVGVGILHFCIKFL